MLYSTDTLVVTSSAVFSDNDGDSAVFSTVVASRAVCSTSRADGKSAVCSMIFGSHAVFALKVDGFFGGCCIDYGTRLEIVDNLSFGAQRECRYGEDGGEKERSDHR